MQDSITRSRFALEDGDLRYALHERQQGTALLEVSAHRRRRELWKRTTRFIRAGGPTGALAMAAAPGTLVVFGSERRGDATLFAIGLDAQTGVERWERPLPAGPAVDLDSLFFNGRFVVFSESWSRRLVALDPATGETAWRIGG
jgi:outer membrane protein assembly factor BamB